MSDENNQNIEFEPPTPTEEATAAALEALVSISGRSFSARHPELGRMVKCQVCNRRHRDSIKCEQKFVELWVEEDLETGEKTVIYATAVQPKGTEIRGQISAEQPTMKQILGAAAFKTKRLNPHPNKRNLQYVELVRALTPDEFDEVDLEKAKKRAKRILAKKLGRFGFLPPIWKRQEPQVASV